MEFLPNQATTRRLKMTRSDKAMKLVLFLNLPKFIIKEILIAVYLVVVIYYPTPSEECGRGGTPRRPNSWAMPQGLDQRSKMDKVPKMTRPRGLDAGQSRR